LGYSPRPKQRKNKKSDLEQCTDIPNSEDFSAAAKRNFHPNQNQNVQNQFFDNAVLNIIQDGTVLYTKQQTNKNGQKAHLTESWYLPTANLSLQELKVFCVVGYSRKRHTKKFINQGLH
jgi:hypothetical protein